MGNFFEDLVHQVMDATLEDDDQRALKAKFHKLKREVIDDVREIFPHGQITPPNLGIKGIRVKLPPKDPNDKSGPDLPVSSGAPAIPDVMRIFSAYVQNELPTYLIYVPDKDKRLVGRNEVKRLFRNEVALITEEDIHSRLVDLKESCPTAHREDAIRDIVKDTLKFAVLSHRWLDSGEPTFYDILKSFKPYGYEKLMKFCEKAGEFGCRLAWSDTCCINKDSSTELEEAIRSMFKWYRDAHICIAYLSDTTSIDDLHEDVWFTRGWTLQELLAPWRMKFYVRNWQPLTSDLNDKENFEVVAALSRATRIPIDDLRYFQPGTNNVHEKMMWASTRTTTRIEDIAYSLIGIFDVSMMVAYGEGKRAFYRLMEAIIHKCDEWQIFAWAGTSSADSAAFPESPRGYLPLNPVDSNDDLLPSTVWRGDRNIVMTKRGLQIQVLLVDLSQEEATVYERIGTEDVQTNAYSSYTAGVVDYWCYDASGDGILQPEQEHLCVLLRPDPSNPYAGWRKVTTPNLVTIRTESKLRRTLTLVWL
ncbi:hypothetical protein BDR07DRAFT_1489285 [Suillus spraguei]|nr:hypothetical protein BDR07DRAFT_1489285 [Suillus spraguei]